MTRENKWPAQGAVYRVASLLTGALIAVGLSGCGSILSQNADNGGMKAKPTVALSPVLGVPQKYQAKVNDQMAAALKEKGVQLVDSKEAELVVKTAYTALPEAKKGTKVSYAIDLIDKQGTRVKRIEGDEVVSKKRGGEAWSHVTEEGMQKVAARSANELTAWIDNPNAPATQTEAAVAAAEPEKAKEAKPTKTAKTPQSSSLAAAVTPAAATSRGEPTVIVPAVIGAPGDGKTALSAAMKKALSQQGFKIVSSGTGAYKIQGQVEVGAVNNGSQSIKISWLVYDPAGKQMEKAIVQKNDVPAGQLDTTWGDTAEQAAGGAASEVLKLINRGPTGSAEKSSDKSTG